jgi:hypothetical protein
MPDNCSSFSACASALKSGDTLIIRDGTYSGAVTGAKAGTTVQAEHDGKVTFTGSFGPGSAGFTMRDIIIKSSDQKELGSNNSYYRMSFVGGPSCGNVVNTLMGANTKIYESAFYGKGGRYLLLAYQQTGGIVIQDIILRPDGGWGKGTGCTEEEPHAAYNMYDTEGFTITRAILIDAISEASGDSENIGGQVVNTHQQHGNVGTISQSVTTTSGEYGRFASDGMGSHNVTIADSVDVGNGYSWGYTRNVAGTTTLTRFTSDSQVSAFKGSLSTTSGAAQIVLNTTFLDDARWKNEMCAGSSVTRGFCGTSATLSAYVASKAKISGGGTLPPAAPAPPSNVHIQ